MDGVIDRIMDELVMQIYSRFFEFVRMRILSRFDFFSMDQIQS